MPIDRDALTARQSYVRVAAGVLFAVTAVYFMWSASAWYHYAGTALMVVAAVIFIVSGIRGLRSVARLPRQESP